MFASFNFFCTYVCLIHNIYLCFTQINLIDGDKRGPVKGYANAKISLTLNEGPFQPKNVQYPLCNVRKFRII